MLSSEPACLDNLVSAACLSSLSFRVEFVTLMAEPGGFPGDRGAEKEPLS